LGSFVEKLQIANEIIHNSANSSSVEMPLWGFGCKIMYSPPNNVLSSMKRYEFFAVK